jgi:hypothetical protein
VVASPQFTHALPWRGMLAVVSAECLVSRHDGDLDACGRATGVGERVHGSLEAQSPACRAPACACDRRAAPALVRPLIKRFYSKGVLNAAKGLPIVGRYLLQRDGSRSESRWWGSL